MTEKDQFSHIGSDLEPKPYTRDIAAVCSPVPTCRLVEELFACTSVPAPEYCTRTVEERHIVKTNHYTLSSPALLRSNSEKKTPTLTTYDTNSTFAYLINTYI